MLFQGLRKVEQQKLEIDLNDSHGRMVGKEEVNLNVVDAGAERMYKRSGFLFPDWEGDVPKGGIDPTTARRAWYPATCRAIERMS